MSNNTAFRIFSVGYGGRKPQDFVSLLQAAGVELIADVRIQPNRASMGSYVRAKTSEKGIEKLLQSSNIAYLWFPELGNPDRTDPEMKLYRESIAPEFPERTARLVTIAQTKRVCLLCAEKRHEECHRKIITDWLEEREWEVTHL